MGDLYDAIENGCIHHCRHEPGADPLDRMRAALAATVICYRTRSALRDVGMALGVDARLIDAFSKDHHWFDDGLAEHRLGELAAQVGAAVNPTQARLWLELTRQLKGAPRHLSQHVGGFVLTETPLHRLVPWSPPP